MKIKLLAMCLLFCCGVSNGVFAASPARGHDYRDQALKAIEQKDLTGAMAILDRAIEANPRDPDTRYIRGTLRLQLNRPQQALDDLKMSIRLGGKWPHLRHKIALARLQLGKQAFVAGQNPTALVLLQLAISDIPEEFKPLTAYWLSMALQRAQDAEQAEQLLTMTLEQQPDTLLRPVLLRHLNRLQRQKKDRDWWMRLQFGVAYDETVDYYPDIYFSTLWPNDKDYRGQLDIGSYWRFRHDDHSATTLSYRLYVADYFKLWDYNSLQQALAVDHRMKTESGNWGWNLQYIDADLGIEGEQNNQTVSVYQSVSPNVRRLSLKKLTLMHNEYRKPTNNQFSGDGVNALYRYYFLSSGRNQRSYLGTQIRYYEAYNPIYTNAVYTLDFGYEGSYRKLDYGILMSLEAHDFINRPNGNIDEQQVHKIYVAYNMLDNLAMELGVKHHEADSAYIMQHSGTAVAYLVTRWAP